MPVIEVQRWFQLSKDNSLQTNMSSISPWCVPSAVSRSERARPLSGLHASLFHPLPALVARSVTWFVQSQFLKCTDVNPVWNFYSRRRKTDILIAPHYEFKNWFWKGDIWVSVALFYCDFTLVSFGFGSYLQAFTISGFSLKHITALVFFFNISWCHSQSFEFCICGYQG